MYYTSSHTRFIALSLVLLFIASFILVSCARQEAAATLNSDRDYLIVVNDAHPYQFGGEYDKKLQSDLIYLPDAYGEATPVEKATGEAFLSLQKDLAEEGTLIAIYTGYLTEENQQGIYNYYSQLEGWAETNTVRKPGYSEHHTGLMLNILIWHQGPEDEVPIWYTETAERQQTILDFAIVHQKLADHGFIDRYPAGKENITGVLCEPYEIRFVGSPETAHAIADANLTLEEFVENLPQK